MKEKIIELVGFGMEPERAELIAENVINVVKKHEYIAFLEQLNNTKKGFENCIVKPATIYGEAHNDGIKHAIKMIDADIKVIEIKLKLIE
jgi:hypothetical protein